MYTSQFFREARPETIRSLIEAYPFATLISQSPVGLMATHLPLILSPEDGASGRLIGHFARGNPQWRDTPEQSEVLAIFNGPHGYVSPRWYSVDPDVPTWNYQAAHVRGTWRIERERGRVLTQLEAMIGKFEAGAACPWRLDSLDGPLIDGLYRGIVAFEIEVTRIDCAFKFSQDKGAADRDGAIAGLEQSGELAALATAQAMRRFYEL